MADKIFCFTGLGGDERLFSKLSIPGFDLVYVPYINALNQEESIEDYCIRFAKKVHCTSNDYLMGVSLGGVMAVELAKHLSYKKVILISSAKTKNEFPPFFDLLKWFNFDLEYPDKWVSFLGIYKGIFGLQTQEEEDLFISMLKKTKNEFFNWSKQAILNWKNTALPSRFIHVHGTSDFVFPSMFIKDYEPVNNGGHFMVYSQAKQVSHIIINQIQRD